MKGFVYKIHCNNCDWKGTEEELVMCIEDYDKNDNPINKRKFTLGMSYDETKQQVFKGCPKCLDDGYLADNGGKDEQRKVYEEEILMNKDKIKVKVIGKYDDGDDIDFIYVYGLTQDEINKVFAEWEEAKSNDEFDGNWEDYFRSKNIRFLNVTDSYDMEIIH